MQVHTIDLDFQNIPQSVAAYLVVGPEGPVLIETGPSSTLETLIAGIKAHGFDPADIRHVLVTHIHLDHAGALGWWAREGARVYVHQVGARHMIDPSKLIASARRIYQDRMDELWGELLPVPAESLTAVSDGDVIQVRGLELTAMDTPGQAGHHHAYSLQNGSEKIAFVGDAAGIRVPDCSLVDVPSPPPEFTPDLWATSIDRMDAAGLAAIYLTHFGVVTDPHAHFAVLRGVLNDITEFVSSHFEANCDREAIIEQYTDWHRQRARDSGIAAEIAERYLSTNAPYMSVDGILRYLRKRRES